MSFDVQEFRKSFPQLERKVGPNSLIYFDSAASTLKHSAVTDRVNTYNRFETANVHRGAHQASQQGTENYEGARKKVQAFVNAKSDQEIIFTRGTTESINLICHGFESKLKPGDEVLISPFEHHSNIVPWQVLCTKTGASLKVVPFDSKSGMSIEAFKQAINENTKIASFIFYSNSFGNRLPVEEMISLCKEKGILTLIDGAQAVLTEAVDVQSLDCDFFCFSGHKIFAPYGIGALYIKANHLDNLSPYQTGGSMIDRVTFEKTTYANSPQKFEAGTPNISGAIGLGTAIDVLKKLDFKDQHAHVVALRNRLVEGLKARSKVEVYEFPSSDYAGVVSFNVQGSHSSDVGTLLDKYAVAVRAGHHCTQPLMGLMGIPGTVRVSVAAYNTVEEVDYFLTIMEKIEEFF